MICVETLEHLVPSALPPRSVPVALEQAIATRDASAIFRILAALPFASGRTCEEPSIARASAGTCALALRMIERARLCGDGELGTEDALCEAFQTSRSLIRQALRTLQDIDMIDVRLGRHGGHRLKRPSPIGIIRQLFSWLAPRNCDPFALNASMWDLNSANIRLAGGRLGEMSAADRDARCATIAQRTSGCADAERAAIESIGFLDAAE